jgi:hypothetical protein
LREEIKIPGLIVKPQFDVKAFTPGTAVYVNAVKGQGELYHFCQYCLVREASPLLLKLGYVKVERRTEVDEDEREVAVTMLRDINLKIDDVAEGKVAVEIVKAESMKGGSF